MISLLASLFVSACSVAAGFAAACLVFKPLLKEAQAMCDKSNEKLKSHAEEFRKVDDARQDAEQRYARVQGVLEARKDEIASLRSKNSHLAKKINFARAALSESLPVTEVSGRTIDHTGSDSQDNTGAS